MTAGLAPRRPEIDEHDLPAILHEVVRRALAVFQHERGSGLAVQRYQALRSTGGMRREERARQQGRCRENRE
jgi:hypothetical protein